MNSTRQEQEIYHFGFIGFGLIGGSIAHALRLQYPEADIMAYNYYETKPHPKLELACREGVLSRIENSLCAFSCCDFIFLCAPVLTNIAYIEKIKPYLKENAILTDVGSVKGDIYEAVNALSLSSHFIGGHPMTGSEKTGYENSDASYLKDCCYVLTPSDQAPSEAVEFLRNFIHTAGAHCIIMDPAEHDRVTAGISHAPHVIAAALVNTVRQRDTSGNYSLLAAGGFRDITRISSSSPQMWQNICLTNRSSILSFLEEYTELLTQAKQFIAEGNEDALLDYFSTAKEYRDNLHTCDKTNPKTRQ